MASAKGIRKPRDKYGVCATISTGKVHVKFAIIVTHDRSKPNVPAAMREHCLTPRRPYGQ